MEDIEKEFVRFTKNREEDILLNDNNPYRILRKTNRDLSAYYCSLPVFVHGRLLKPFWVKRENGRIYEGINARICVADGRVIMENENGKAEVRFDGEVELQPTYNGIVAESSENNVKVFIRADADRCVRENGSFWALMKSEYQPFFVLSGLFGRVKGRSYPLKMEAKREKDGFEITIAGGTDTEKLLFEMNLHVPKLIFDTTVESKNPAKNNVFGSVAFLGRTEEYGEQWLYSRIDGMRMSDLSGYRVESAKLYLPRFENSVGGKLEAYKLGSVWCSFGTSWDTKAEFTEKMNEAESRGRYEEIDISDIVRDMLRVKEARNPGFVIKSRKSSGCMAVATGDSYYRPQILKIQLKNI